MTRQARGEGTIRVLLRRFILAMPGAAWFALFALASICLYLPILLGDGFFWLFRPVIRRRLQWTPVDTSRATIIIVTWNGRKLLDASLPPLLAEIDRDGGQHDVIVVDNGSTDGSVEFVQRNFPRVRVIALPTNLGFGEGNNVGARAAMTDVIVFLNNDMVVEPGFLRPLLRRMVTPGTFAVASQIFFQDQAKRREETGLTRGEFARGRWRMRHDPPPDDLSSDVEIPVLWAGGGAAAFHRKGFLALGGFDSLYHPFYWEDSDLSYRAWKAGWRCIFAPDSRVLHCHRASTSRFGQDFVDLTIRRNEYLFTWRNLTRPWWLAAHFAALPTHATREAREQGPGFAVKTLARAVQRYRLALGRRYAAMALTVRSDDAALAGANGWPPPAGAPAIDFSLGAYSLQLGKGWHEREGAPGRQFRWITRRAEAYLLANGSERLVQVVGYLPEPALRLAGGRQRLTLSIGGRARGAATLIEPGTFSLVVPIQPPRPGWQLVALRAGFAFTPAALGIAPDQRELALCIGKLAFVERPST